MRLREKWIHHFFSGQDIYRVNKVNIPFPFQTGHLQGWAKGRKSRRKMAPREEKPGENITKTKQERVSKNEAIGKAERHREVKKQKSCKIPRMWWHSGELFSQWDCGISSTGRPELSSSRRRRHTCISAPALRALGTISQHGPVNDSFPHFSLVLLYYLLLQARDSVLFSFFF